jgi:hypothetical protein
VNEQERRLALLEECERQIASDEQGSFWDRLFALLPGAAVEMYELMLAGREMSNDRLMEIIRETPAALEFLQSTNAEKARARNRVRHGVRAAIVVEGSREWRAAGAAGTNGRRLRRASPRRQP